jgi:hypothetical protein
MASVSEISGDRFVLDHWKLIFIYEIFDSNTLCSVCNFLFIFDIECFIRLARINQFWIKFLSFEFNIFWNIVLIFQSFILSLFLNSLHPTREQTINYLIVIIQLLWSHISNVVRSIIDQSLIYSIFIRELFLFS